MAAFLGMRGTGDFTVTGQRPENWRQKILELFPNGDAPLTAMMSMMGEEKTDDPHFHWFTRTLATQSVSGTAGSFIYKNTSLATAYAASDDFAAGTTVYAKMSEADAKTHRAGHQVLMRDASDYRGDINGLVTADPTLNGASSYVTIKLLEADGASPNVNDLSTCDTLLIIGSAHPEGAAMPESVTYDPTEKENYTQIFRSTFKLTRTAMQTRLRTGDAYADAKKQCLRYHSIEMEKALIFGISSDNTGANGEPERTTQGIINAIQTDVAANAVDYSLDANSPYASATWEEQGKRWLDEKLEILFRYGSDEKMAYVGSGALLGINRLAELYGDINITPSTKSFGIQVMDWITPFGVIHLKRHPLFSYEATNRNSMLILEPKNLKLRIIQDTLYQKDKDYRQGGNNKVDALVEGYLTELGLEYHHMETNGFFNGIGVDNVN